MTTRRPWGSGTVRKVGPDAYQIRWSLGTDPFTGKHLRKAETLHGVTKAEAQRILNQRIEESRQDDGVVTCPSCGVRFYAASR